MALTPQELAGLEAAAALMQGRTQSGVNTPGGLTVGQAGQLSAAGSGMAGSLYDYAQTAPVLSLKGNTEYENLNFQPLPGQTYRLMVNGQEAGRANTPEGVASLVSAANQASEQGGKQADVRLQSAEKAFIDGEVKAVFADTYVNAANNNGFLDIAIPAALAVMGGVALGPLISGTAIPATATTAATVKATALGLAAGVGAGATTGNLLVGQPLDESLLRGLTAAATAYGGAGLGPVIGGGSFGVGAGAAGANLAANLAQGKSLEDALISAGISGIAAGGADALFGGGASKNTPTPTGTTPPPVPSTTNLGAGIGGSGFEDAIQTVLGSRIVPALTAGIGGGASATVMDIGKDLIDYADTNKLYLDYLNKLTPEQFGGRAAYNAFMNGYPEGYMLTNAGQLTDAAGNIIETGLIPGSQAALDFAVSLKAGTAGAAAGSAVESTASTLANAGAGALNPAAIAAATAAAAAQSGGNNTTTPVAPATSSTSTQQGGDNRTTPVAPATSSTSTQQGGDNRTTPVAPATSSTSTQQGGDNRTPPVVPATSSTSTQQGGDNRTPPVVPVTVNTNTNTGGDTTTPVVPIQTPSTNTPTSRTETVVLPVQTPSNTSTAEQGMPFELLPPDVLAAITVQQILGDSQAGPTTKQKALSTLKTIAGLTPLIGVLADAVGGGGGGGGTLDAGPGLPVGGIGGGRGRIPATFDPFTYGQREGEFEFFRNLPATTGTVTGIGGTGTTTGATGTGTTTGGTGTTGTTGTTTTGAPGTSTTATAAEVQAAFPGYTNIRQDAQGRWFGEPIPGYTASGPAPTGLRVTAAGTFNPTVDDYRFFNPGFESIEPNAAGQYVGSRTVDVPGAPGMTLEQIRAANPGYENYSVNPAGQYVGTRTTPASTRTPTLADYQAANPGFTRIEQGPDGQYYGFRNVTTTTAGPPVTLDQVRAANPGYEDYGINDAGQFYGTRTVTEGPALAEGGEVDDDMVRHLIEYRKGGGHMGPGQVKGIGSGQEDKIPAWLSDGEYVWSAQDVADLGDGSTDEGVRRLDRMRKMVRQRAGRKDVKKIAKPQRGIEDMLKAVGGAV
jgi:hypothetical protein